MKLSKRLFTANPVRTGVLTLAMVYGGCVTASADWDTFWYKIKLGFHRNNAWPQPFAEADARSAVEPFEIMKRNGWRLHNTISHDLFRASDGVLLASGNEKVRWITNYAPQDQRRIFVLEGRTQKETDARLASVRQTVEAVRGDNPSPEILTTTTEPGYSSGAVAVRVNRAWLEATPTPVLPTTSASGTAGVGGAN